MNPSKRTAYMGLLLFSIGALTGMLMYGLSIWADIEASLFDTSIMGDAPFRDLSCPPMITTNETGIVKAKFSNPTDRPMDRAVRINISHGYITLMRQLNTRVQLEPGEDTVLEWEVTVDDAAWERFVMVRLYAFRSSPLPAASGACGILVVDVPVLTGNQVAIGLIVISVLGMGSGAWLWTRAHQPLTGKPRYARLIMAGVAVIILAGIIFGLLGQWIIGVLLFMINVLLILVTAIWAFGSP